MKTIVCELLLLVPLYTVAVTDLALIEKYVNESENTQQLLAHTLSYIYISTQTQPFPH